MASRDGRALTVAVVEPGTAQGHEVCRHLPEAGLNLAQTLLLAEPPEGEVRARPEGVELQGLPLDEHSFDTADVAFFCGGGAALLERYRPRLEESGVVTVDLSGTSGAGVTAGWPVVAGVNERSLPPGGLVRGPHAATVVLATLLEALEPWQPLSVQATVHLPAAMDGVAALEELSQQMLAMFRFTESPREVLGRQLALNLFPESDTEALGVETELRQVMGDVSGLGVVLLRAPLYMAVTAVVQAELGDEAGVGELEQALAETHRVRVHSGPLPPGPGELSEDQTDSLHVAVTRAENGRVRLWCVADLLRRCVVRNALDAVARFFGSPDA